MCRRKKGGDYNTQRTSANEWFNSALMAGNLAGETARSCLEKDGKDGANALSAKQIDLYTEEARDLGAAQFMVRNIPNNSTRIEVATQIARLEHPLGRGYIRDLDGNTISLKADAAAQRARNNKLDGIDVIDLDSATEVIELDSKCSSVTVDRSDVERENHTKRLKKKAMTDIVAGSPGTKALGKKLFKQYQEMSRDSVRYVDQIEMLVMYKEDTKTASLTHKFDSLDAHNTFKSIEK